MLIRFQIKFILFICLVLITFFGLLPHMRCSLPKDVSQYCLENRSQIIKAVMATPEYALFEDILTAKQQPIPNRDIFFHDFSCQHEIASFPQCLLGSIYIYPLRLAPQKACAIEAAAMHNPDRNVFVIFMCPTFYIKSESNTLLSTLLNYSNINFRNLDIITYVLKTPAYEWFNSGDFLRSKHIMHHLYQTLRFITLWRWGGTYLDLDMIILKPLKLLDSRINYAGLLPQRRFGTSVLSLSIDRPGEFVANTSLYLIRMNLNPFKKNFYIAEDSFGKVLEMEFLITIHPTNVFYPLSYYDARLLLSDKYHENLWQLIENSFSLKTWGLPILFDGNGVRLQYSRILKEHCPKLNFKRRN